MLPGMELMGCSDLAVPAEVMHHVVRIESSYNPYAIGVVGGRLVRQPRNLPEAVATAQMLESRGYNFSVGLAQVNRYNLKMYGIDSYDTAFKTCPNLAAGARILAECHSRSKGDWGDSLSCYYSGNFVTGYRHGYVQKVFASMNASQAPIVSGALPIEVASRVQQTPGLATPSVRSAQSGVASIGNPLVTIRSSPGRALRAVSIDSKLAVGAATSETVTTASQAPRRLAAEAPEVTFQVKQSQSALTAQALPEMDQDQAQSTNVEDSNTDSAFVF